MSRIGRHSAVYGAGVVLSKAVAFLMLPVYTRYLTPADYGTLQLIDMTMEVVSIVAGSRLGAGIFYFYHKADTEEARKGVLASALVVLCAAFAIGATATLVLAPWLAMLIFGTLAPTGLIRIAAVSLALQSLLTVPTSSLQLQERSGTFVAVNAAKLGIQLVLNLVLLVGFHEGVRGVLVSTLVANLAIGSWLSYALIRQVGLRFSRRAATDILRFGMPFIGTHLAKYVVTFGDRYFLQAFSGTAVVGIYGLAYQFGFLLAALGDGPFRSTWEPLRFEVAKRPDRDVVYAKAFIYLNLLQVTMGVGISLFVPEFLRVMATAPFRPAAAWVPIILLAYLQQSWSLFLNAGLYVRERAALVTWATWLGAITALVSYTLLIPPLGALGAAIATLLSFVVLAGSTHYYSQREWRISYRWGPVARLLAGAFAVCGAAYLVPPLALPMALTVKALLFCVYALLVWMLDVLSEEERSLVRLLVTQPRSVVAKLVR